MKKLWNKLEHNKFFFAIFMIIAFALFKLVTTGFNGAFGFGGIIHYFMDVAETTDAGQSILGEILWGLCLLPILIIFGNKYIFSQKSKPFKERIAVTWPMIAIIVMFLLLGFKYIITSKFNVDEFFASMLLYFFVGVYEEFLCRGWLLNEFMERFGQNRKGVVYSVLLSALLFGFMHITNILAGQSVASTIAQIVMATVVGIYLGIVYLKTKNIWTVVILHGLYDFSLSLTSINVTSTCFIPTGTADLAGVALIGTAISGIIVNLFFDTPCFFIALKYFTKMGANEVLYGEPIALNDGEIRGSKIAKKVFTIIAIVFSGIAGTIMLLGTLSSSADEDVCLNYQTKEISNYEITTMDVNDYKIEYNTKIEYPVECITFDCESITYNISNYYTFTNNVDSLSIKNKSGKETTLDYHNIIRMAIYKNDESYVVMVVDNVEAGTEVYYINFKESMIGSDDFVDYFTDNIKKLDLPVVLNVGYLTENDNRLPLFKTLYDTYYILDTDGSIKLLQIK